MKVKPFVAVLSAYAEAIAAHGDRRLVVAVSKLQQAWSPAMAWAVKDLFKRALPRTPVAIVETDTVAEFRNALVRLESIVKTVGQKGFKDDLAALIQALEPHAKEDLAAFIQACQLALKETAPQARAVALDEDAAQQYAQLLRETHKESEKFLPVYEKLQSDKRMKQAEMARIASLVAYETAPSTKRAESLRRIWMTHEAYASSAAKSKFSGGKSAA